MASTKVPSELIANTAILGQHLHTTLGNTGVTANSSGLFIGQSVATSDTVQFQTVTGSHAGTIAAATTGTTQANTDNSAKMATTEFVTNKIQELIGGAPGTLDTLNELAAAINDDATYNSTLTTALALKAPIASPTFTGTGRMNGDWTVGAATGEDKLVIAPQAAGSGTFLISYNDAGNAYEPLTADFETLALRTSGTPRLSIDSSGTIALAGNLTTTGTIDGVDIAARDAILSSTTTTAGAALPKAGGTMTGDLILGDNVEAKFGASDDLQIYHDGSDSYIKNNTGRFRIFGDQGYVAINVDAGYGNAVSLEYANSTKLKTTGSGVYMMHGATFGSGGDTILENYQNGTSAQKYFQARNTFQGGVTDGSIFGGMSFRRHGGTGNGITGYIRGVANGTSGNMNLEIITGTAGSLTQKVLVKDAGVDITGNIGVTGTVDGVDIAARDAILTSTTTTAGAALPKAGGTMTGAFNITDSILINYSGNDGGGRDAGLKIQNDGSDWGAYIRKASAAQYGMRIDSAGSLALAIYGSEGGSDLNFSVDGSSGNVLSTGDIGMATGHSSGKFAVMATSVHGSYDFYNNGTSYFNGATIVDATLQINNDSTDAYSPGSFLDYPTMTLKHPAGNGYYNGTRVTNNSGSYEWFYGATQTSGNEADFVFQGYDRTGGAYKEMLRIQDSGNVGIGQIPGTNNKLTVKGSVIGTAANLAESAQLAILSLNYPRGNVNSGLHFGYATANYIQAADDSGSNSKQLTLNPFGGNVGIGKTNPGAKLEISGKDDAGAGDLLRLQFDNSPADTGITFTDIGDTVKNRISMDSGNTNDLQISAGTQMSFHTGTTGSGNNRMMIDTSGNVSIGGTPSSGGSGSRWLSLDTPGTNTYTGGLLYKINGTTKGYHYVENDYMMHQTVAGGGQKFYANAAVAMTLESSGKLITSDIRATKPISSYSDSGAKQYSHLCTGSFYQSTGYLVIHTNIPGHNQSGNANMLSFKVRGFEYAIFGAIDMNVGVYCGEGNYYSASYNGTYVPEVWRDNIQFATDSNGKLALILGTASTVQRIEMAVTDFIQGFINVNESYSQGWTITHETSLSGYSMQTDLAPRMSSPRPAFHAYLTNTTAFASGTSNRILGSVEHNDGNHYDAGTGKFTVPTAGIYHFDMALQMSSSTVTQTYASAEIRINSGTRYIGGWFEKTGASYGAATGSVTLKLDKNDYVEFVVELAAGTNALGGSPGYTYLSGTQIG
ncbi:hypothetical protein N9J19_00080 [bacterium]|nr:hypothetical protein [bacterium]